MAKRVGVVILAVLGSMAFAAEDDFGDRAKAARDASDWASLAAVAFEWGKAEPESATPHAYAALAAARLGELTECVGALRRIEEAGASVDANVRGFGTPMSSVVDAVYAKCWADWEPEANRKLWQELFDAFPQSPSSVVPAARLLMSALKLGDEEAVKRYESYFTERLAAANERRRGGADRTGYFYAQAYARAGVAGERPLRVATEAFQNAWEAAARKHRYEGPDAEGGDDLEKREACDLDTDAEYNVLALTCAVNGAYEAPANPLAEREATPGAIFDDVTEELGLAGVASSRVAVGDYDDDGDLDLCLRGRLFRNEGGKGFEDVTESSGLSGRGASALFGDYDDDGDLDLVLANRSPRLWRNQGKRGGYRFEDVTAEAKLDAVSLGATPEGSSWLDADGDGRLDLYFAAYEQPMSTGHADVLLSNRGDGTFEDVTAASGLALATPYCGRGVATADYDDDGDLDLYVSNYRLQPNVLFRNDGEGAFANVGEALGVHGVRQPADGRYYGHTIGSVFGDVDGDGDLDLFAANLAHPRFVAQGFSNLSMLYIRGGEGSEAEFVDERRVRGIRFQETHSDPALVDFDNDGDLDLSITCVYEGVPTALYQNDGRGRFDPVTFASRAVAFNGWGQAWFDFDGDGDLDWIVASNSGCRVFRNRGNDHHWLGVRLEGKRTNRFGIGARVSVETLGEDRRVFVRELTSARGTTSQDGEILHFGLGDYDGRVRITVRWPDTLQEESQTIRTDRVATIKQVKVVRKKR